MYDTHVWCRYGICYMFAVFATHVWYVVCWVCIWCKMYMYMVCMVCMWFVCVCSVYDVCAVCMVYVYAICIEYVWSMYMYGICICVMCVCFSDCQLLLGMPQPQK